MTKGCGIGNLAYCLPEKFFEFLENMINAPLQPLLDGVRFFLDTPPVIDIFGNVWAIIIYIISLFYGLLMAYAGFCLLVSGYDAMKRSMAKETIKNVIVMMVLVQMSFFLYQILLEISASLASMILSLINPYFFLIEVSSLSHFGSGIFILVLYVIVLLISLLFLMTNYIIVCSGVIFFPVGIFLYHVESTKSYGKSILSFLITACFMNTIVALILLAVSMLTQLPNMYETKTFLFIAGFLLTDIAIIFLYFNAVSKAASSVMGSSSYKLAKKLT